VGESTRNGKTLYEARLDVGEKNIELTVYLVVGTDAEGGVGNPVPKELESVVAQIRSAFPFKNYRQLDVVEARTRTGEKLHTSSDGGKWMARRVERCTSTWTFSLLAWLRTARQCGWTTWTP